MSSKPHTPGESEEFPEYDADDDEMKEYVDDEPKWGQEEEAAVEKDLEEDRKIVEETERPPKRKLGTGEKIYLYVRVGPGSMQVIDRTFDSRIEASQHAEENFKGTPYQTMSESEIREYVEEEVHKKERRQEIKEEAKTFVKKGAKLVAKGAVVAGKEIAREVKATTKDVIKEAKPTVKKYGGAFLRASEDIAEKQRFTKRHVQPAVEKAWGVQPRQPPPPQRQLPVEERPRFQFQPQPRQRPRFNFPQQSFGRPPPREEPKKGIQQPQRPRFNFQPPQQRRMQFNFPKPTMRLNIPRQDQPPQRQRKQFGPEKTDDKGYNRFNAQSPFKPMRFNFDGKLHAARPHFIGGRPQSQPEQKKPKKKSKIKGGRKK